ncbi:hypothetical protein J2772_000927 [Chryseobacterium jejuense]|nr:hypothetical protein [Chryseobacterium jejuense]
MFLNDTKRDRLNDSLFFIKALSQSGDLFTKIRF